MLANLPAWLEAEMEFDTVDVNILVQSGVSWRSYALAILKHC